MHSEPKPKRRLRWSEFIAILGLAAIVLSIGGYALFTSAVNAMKDADCGMPMKQFGITCKMYAGENYGLYPSPRAFDCQGIPVGFGAAPDAALLVDYGFAAYDMVCLRNPVSLDYVDVFDGRAGGTKDGIVEPCEITEWPRFYFAWVLPSRARFDDLAATAFGEAIAAQSDRILANPDARDDDWPIESTILRAALEESGSPNPSVIPRLRDGGTDIEQAGIPVCWDGCASFLGTANAWHGDRSGQVLFADGHVEIVPRPPAGRIAPFPLNAGGRALYDATVDAADIASRRR